jgi:cell division septation protein DedD
MSRLLDDDQDDLPERERELTLSTGAILAIFLGLVLLCAVFFGFGYNLGRKSTTVPNAPLPAATNDAEPAGTGNSSFDNFKPSPGSPSASSATTGSTPTPRTPAITANAATNSSANATGPEHVSVPVHTTPAPAPGATRPAASASTSTPTPTHAAQPPAPAIAPGGSFVVQIAAISGTHKDDADLLVNALHSKGYQVSERTETQDKLIHIQVGPFATKADAEAMRERLIVDGYNAIVK